MLKGNHLSFLFLQAVFLLKAAWFFNYSKKKKVLKLFNPLISTCMKLCTVFWIYCTF